MGKSINLAAAMPVAERKIGKARAAGAVRCYQVRRGCTRPEIEDRAVGEADPFGAVRRLGMIEPSRRIILRPLILERRGQQPISFSEFDRLRFQTDYPRFRPLADQAAPQTVGACRSEEHTSEIQSL